jgi:uncharacterized membrane protein
MDMSATTRTWILGTALMLAGIVMIVVGAVASAVEVTVALPATGAALLAGGLVAVLLGQPGIRAAAGR